MINNYLYNDPLDNIAPALSLAAMLEIKGNLRRRKEKERLSRLTPEERQAEIDELQKQVEINNLRLKKIGHAKYLLKTFGRNGICDCGSGKKIKKCCGDYA